MIAVQATKEIKRLTTTEEVFRRLRSDIISLQLPPGSKISEVEIAKTCDVSRQPVREAFMRLGELNLVEIRPQRATRVRKISEQELFNTRFIRAAVEVEVVRVACNEASDANLALLGENLEKQKRAVEAKESDVLKELDYEFHNLICIAANREAAFKTIAENKTHTDRVCTLELSVADGMAEVLVGHAAIYDAICAGNEEEAVKATRLHLMHLDATLDLASKNYPDFFEA